MNFEIGTINTPNPWLWVNTTNLTDYQVSSASPGETWVPVNQFCSILAVRWLQNPATTFGFRDLSGQQQLEDASTLQGFDSLQSQTAWAVTQLGGEEVDTQQLLTDLPNLNPGTQIWLGNNVHTTAALIRAKGKVKTAEFYNPDTGDTDSYLIDELSALIPAWNINAAVVKKA